MTFQEITYPDDLQADLDQAHAVLGGHDPLVPDGEALFPQGWRNRLGHVECLARPRRRWPPQPLRRAGRRHHSAKLAEDELQDQTLLLESILDQLGDAVVVADKEGRFLILNQAARKLHGLRPTETPPRDWSRSPGLFLPDGVTVFPAEHLPLRGP